jgi:hypothetical protein
VAESLRLPPATQGREQWALRTPPRTLYDSALRSTVEQAFDATWTALQARDPFRDFERDYELKTTLRRKLIGLAADGVTDPIELREWALEGLPR